MKEYASHELFIRYVVTPEISGNNAIYDTAAIARDLLVWEEAAGCYVTQEWYDENDLWEYCDKHLIRRFLSLGDIEEIGLELVEEGAAELCERDDIDKSVTITTDKYVIFANAEVVLPGERLPYFSFSVYSRAEWESDDDFVEEITIDGGTLSLDNPRSDAYNHLIAWCV